MVLHIIRSVYRTIVSAPRRIQMYEMRRHLITQMQYGGTRYTCEICGKRARRYKDFDLTSRSRPDGIVPQGRIRNTICPWCGSNLRHRLFWTIGHECLKRCFEARRQRIKVLHFAPEQHLSRRLRMLEYVEYVTADLSRQDVDHRLDLTRLDLPDACIDVVIAIHVLEHIPNDQSAMMEILRILRPGGWAALMVPIIGDTTHEDPSITLPEDRIKYFGQENHVRLYGMDFFDRLCALGFDVKAISYQDVFGTKVERNFQHDAEGTLFIAYKPVVSLLMNPRPCQ
ncbi:MAG: class I SAM-dependent methyltransferase [Nitrospiraceae bacterium]